MRGIHSEKRTGLSGFLLAGGVRGAEFCSAFLPVRDFVMIGASIQLVYETFSSLGGTSSRGQSVCKKCCTARRRTCELLQQSQGSGVRV